MAGKKYTQCYVYTPGDKPYNKKCAVGIVSASPAKGELGEFDNDEFFDLILMPHRPEDDYVQASKNYKAAPPKPGIVAKDEQGHVDAHPDNDLYLDGFQGQEFLRPRDDLDADLGYNTEQLAPNEFHTASRLHCEAEGDFWVRISDLASALGLLLSLLTLVTVGATAGGAGAGAAIGCEIGSVFGPLGCIIGAILGAILGGLLAGGVAAGLSYLLVSAILQAIFDADPGDVEDANVGDKALEPITEGDRVVLRGEHVYDGFHQGWHEFHPLLTVIKLGEESPYYLQWDPTFGDGSPLPVDLPGMPSTQADDITKLTVADMRSGLDSAKFRRRAVWLRDRWCAMLREASSAEVQQKQQSLGERWTIHPAVDGCQPDSSGGNDGPPPPH